MKKKDKLMLAKEGEGECWRVARMIDDNVFGEEIKLQMKRPLVRLSQIIDDLAGIVDRKSQVKS